MYQQTLPVYEFANNSTEFLTRPIVCDSQVQPFQDWFIRVVSCEVNRIQVDLTQDEHMTRYLRLVLLKDELIEGNSNQNRMVIFCLDFSFRMVFAC